MRSGLTQEQINNNILRQYIIWAVGDGVKVEFPLGKNITRMDDLIVNVAGLMLRPSDKGTAFDYSVRGITPGYAGDTNTVSFSVAPAGAANICFIVNAT